MFLPIRHEIKETLKRASGFTLIELLVVIGILAILLAIVLIAVNPPRQFALARNSQRRSDVLTVLNAVGQYFAENGSLPASIGTVSATISDTAADICSDIVPTYVSGLPLDPQTGSGSTDCTPPYDTGYTIQRNTSNRVTVSAPGSEDPDGGGSPPTISVTR